MVRETPSISEVPEKKTFGGWLKNVFKKKPDVRNTPEYRETRNTTRKSLSVLKESIGGSLRDKTEALRKRVLASPNIARDKDAILAYQQLIRLVDPHRFQTEIGVADGIFGPRTRAAYERDVAILHEPRQNWLQRLFGRRSKPKESEKKSSSKKGDFNVANKEYYNAQNLGNNCGATACSIAAAKLTGENPEKLEKQFTKDRPGKMYWDSPSRWLRPLGLYVQQRNNLTPSEINNHIKNGSVVIASVTPKSKLTSGGHITTLVESQNTGNGYRFINADPNYYNIAKGYGVIDEKQISQGGTRQFWVVSKNTLT